MYMSVAEETANIVSALPLDKARAVLDFARFLADQADERAWDERLAGAGDSARFRERVAEANREITQGKSSPLDANQL
jgi:hypothetical protein